MREIVAALTRKLKYKLGKIWVYLKEKAYCDVSNNQKPLKSSNLYK